MVVVPGAEGTVRVARRPVVSYVMAVTAPPGFSTLVSWPAPLRVYVVVRFVESTIEVIFWSVPVVWFTRVKRPEVSLTV